MRFGYGYDRGTSMQQRVKLPLERMHDGIFVGLSHRSKSATVPITHLKIQLNFYKAVDFPWLKADKMLTVPAGSKATFKATMAVPELTNVGLYEATIRLNDGTNTVNVPVVANVAAFSTEFLFGGPPETMTPYDNGQVYGYFDWTGRAESGDWRFYFMDVPEGTPAGASLLIDNRWTGAKTDIDTIVMGPTKDCFSNGVGCNPSSFEGKFPGSKADYGPYSLYRVGGSNRWNPRAGVWYQDTTTGGPREIVAAPAVPGLHLIALHNVMFDGSQPQERFQGQVGTIVATPNVVDVFVGNATSGSFPLSIKASLPLTSLSAEGFGLGVPDVRKGLPQKQDNPDDISTSSYQIPVTLSRAALLEVSVKATNGDMDLFVLYDANDDGNFDFNNEVYTQSATSAASEHVSVTFPDDGNYLVAVHGFGAAANGKFDLTINAVQGESMKVSAPPAGPHQPNVAVPFTVDWKLDKPLAVGEASQGLILAGPNAVPGALNIHVRLHNVVSEMVTADLPPMADATLSRGLPTTTYGDWTNLYVAANDTLRAALKFDLSGIQSTYPVQSAKLYVYVDSYGSTGQPHTLEVYGLTKAWTEPSVTWNAPWTTPGGDYALPAVGSVPISSASVGKWLEVDVTNLAAGWVADPASNQGVLLRVINGAAFAKFRLTSREYWGAQKPYLKIVYGKP